MTEVILAIFIPYQAEKWWDDGLLVDATPNCLNLDHNNNVAVSEENY